MSTALPINLSQDWLFSNPPAADYNRNDYTAFNKKVRIGISGCRKKRLNNGTVF